MIGEFILREKRNVGEYIFKNKLQGDEYTGQTFEKRIVGKAVKDWGFWKENIFLKGRIIKSLQYALCISRECLFLAMREDIRVQG